MKRYYTLIFILITLLSSWMMLYVNNGYDIVRNEQYLQEATYVNLAIQAKNSEQVMNKPNMIEQLSATIDPLFLTVANKSFHLWKQNIVVVYATNLEAATMMLPLKEGRFFSEQDRIEQRPVVILGQHQFDLLSKTERENKIYIDSSGVTYQIIGLAGFSQRTSIFDDLLYVLSDQIPQSANLTQFPGQMSCLRGCEVSVQKVLGDQYELTSVSQGKFANSQMGDSLGLVRFMEIYLSLFVLLAIFIYIFSYTISDKLQSIITLKLLLGASKQQLYSEIIARFVGLCVLSALCVVGTFSLIDGLESIIVLQSTLIFMMGWHLALGLLLSIGIICHLNFQHIEHKRWY